MNDTTNRKVLPSDPKTEVQGELRLATVLMLDIVGSTEISERLGPEQSFLLLQEVLEPARAIVADHGGFTMEETGDGLFALFGAPMSVERASLAACRAGLAICRAVQDGAAGFLARFGQAPSVRVGLAEGEVMIAGYAAGASRRVTGSTVSLATRLQAQAEPGQVVCSAGVVSDSQGWVRFKPLGQRTLKGFSAPVDTFQVLDLPGEGNGPALGTSRFSGDFVGREAEIASLQAWYADPATTRAVNLIVGDAGIGKSRLLGELVTRIGGRRFILGTCQATVTARPLAPLVEIMRTFAGWTPNMSREDLISALRPILPDMPDDQDTLLAVISAKALTLAEHNPSYGIALRRTLAQAIGKLGQRHDCLVAIEDVHWIDPLSAEVLLSIVAAAPRGFRMLGTTRPVDRVDRLSKDKIEITRAGPMPEAEIAAIAQSMIGHALDRSSIQKVTSSSEGNPFFAIEILHGVAARGGAIDTARIGPVQNLALARFDQLEPATRDHLRIAAVIGRSFRFDVLRSVTGLSDEGVLRTMTAAEGIVEPDPSDPWQSGRFNHVLFRDSIYSTLPTAARKALHLAAGQATETCLGTGTQVADILADHYELAEARHQAVTYLRVAARRAYGLYALESCRSLIDRMFRLVEPAWAEFPPADLVDMLLQRVHCLDMLDQYRDICQIADEWLPRVRGPEGSAKMAELLGLVSKSHCHLANFDHSRKMVLEALSMAQAAGDARAEAYAKVVLMRVLADSQPNSEAEVERLFEETREEVERVSDDPLYTNRMWHLISAYKTQGRMRRAFAANAELTAYAERHRRPYDILAGHWSLGALAGESNDVHTMQEHARIVVDTTPPRSAFWDIGMMQILVAKTLLGEPVPEGAMRGIRDRTTRRGELVTRNAAELWTGIADLFAGRVTDGWRQVCLCEEIYDKTATLSYRRLYLLVKAEILLSIAGLINQDRPKPRLGLRDMMTAIRLRLKARRNAETLIRRLLAQFDREQGHIVARALVCLAVIERSRGQAAAASERFALAERLLREEGLAAELDRLEQIRGAAR